MAVHRTGQFPRQSQMWRVLWGSEFTTKTLFVGLPILQTHYINWVRKHQLQWHERFNHFRIRVSFFLAHPILKPHRGFVAPLGPDEGPHRWEAALKQKYIGYVNVKIQYLIYKYKDLISTMV